MTRQPAAVRARGLLGACHPGPTMAVTVLAVLIAVAAGAGGGVVLLVGLAVLAGQLSIGWSNDWIDAGRDTAVGRTDKPVATDAVGRSSVRNAAWVALVAAIPLSLALGLRSAAAHAVLVAGGWAYNLGLKATVWSFVPYAVSFGALPFVPVAALPGHPMPPWWLVATGSLLGVGAHLTNALPDLEEDRATGVVGLPHVLGRRVVGIAAPTLLFGASLLVVLAPAGPATAAGWVGLTVGAAVLLAAAVAAATRPTSRLPFLASVVVALIDVVLLVVSGSALTR